MRRIIAGFKLLGVVVIGLVIMPFQLLIYALHKPTARRTPWLFHRSMVGLIQMKLNTRGTPAINEPVIYISNHTTYVDVVILGSLIKGCFVAKSEVAGWPFFGWLAQAGRTIFVDRARRHSSGRQRDAMVDKLKTGDNVIFFPEGTSTNGNHVNPFKSTLLAAAEVELEEGHYPLVQPIAIAFTGIHGMPMGRGNRPKFAWYGDMELIPHLYELMQVGPCEVEVSFLEPVRITDFSSRKALSNHCQAVISEEVGELLQSRA